MNPFKTIKEAIHTAYLGLKILGRLNNLTELFEDGLSRLLRRMDKMDQATQDAINAVKKAVTDGTDQLKQVITDEGNEIKQKVQDVINHLPSGTDPEVVTQLNDLAGAVSNSFQSLTSGVQNLSDNVAGSSGDGSGETPVP